MPHDNTAHLIKNGAVIDEGDGWIVLAKDASVIPKDGQVLAPVELWNELRGEVVDSSAESSTVGIWLDSNESPELIANDIDRLPIIAINFPVFSDGRGYSYARTLREQYNFSGDIRAIGDVLPDQVAYMTRCGFSSFELRSDRDPADALARLGDFSDAYQASQDERLPLFARR